MKQPAAGACSGTSHFSERVLLIRHCLLLAHRITVVLRCMILLLMSLFVFSISSDISPEISGLKQFTTAMFVDATARCVHVIDPSVEVQYRLPPSMAAQFRVGANIATAVQVIINLNVLQSVKIQTYF